MSYALGTLEASRQGCPLRACTHAVVHCLAHPAAAVTAGGALQAQGLGLWLLSSCAQLSLLGTRALWPVWDLRAQRGSSGNLVPRRGGTRFSAGRRPWGFQGAGLLRSRPPEPLGAGDGQGCAGRCLWEHPRGHCVQAGGSAGEAAGVQSWEAALEEEAVLMVEDIMAEVEVVVA